jgi:hypothetical protein
MVCRPNKSRSPAPGQPAAPGTSSAASENLIEKIANLKLKPAREPRRQRIPGEPDLVPLFPILYLTPRSDCPHGGPLRPGTRLTCMVCSRSGLDHLAALRRSPATDPKPEPKPEPPAPKKLTRKELRALQREWRPREATLSPEERSYLVAHGVALGG